MKILVRGDCTSQRTIGLNETLFGVSPRLVVDAMTPTQLLLDGIDGLRADRNAIEKHINLDRLDNTQKRYFQNQFELNTLAEDEYDLVVLDSYADMKFHLYQSRRFGWRFWADRTEIRNWDAFNAEYLWIGRPNLREAADNFERLIRFYRRSQHDLPVLFLSQLTAFRPSDYSRRAFERLGAALRRRVPNLWWGGRLPKSALVPEDLSENGQTYHFSGQNYRSMVLRAVETGFPLERLRLQGRAHTTAFYIAGKPVTTGQVLKQEFDIPSLEAIRTAAVAFGPFRACPAGCAEFIERRATSRLGEYLPEEKPRHGWTKRYIPMARSLKDLASVSETQQPTGERAGTFARLGIENELSVVSNGWDKRIAGRASSVKRESWPAVGKPLCGCHWALDFGMFHEVGGQEELVAFANIIRVGELLLVGQIGDSDGWPCYARLERLLKIIAIRAQSGDDLLRGAKWIMNGGLENGDIQLLKFKRAIGLKPTRLFWDPPQAEPAKHFQTDARLVGRSTISSYRRFVQTHLARHLTPIRYSDYVTNQERTNIVLLRHDVDHSLENALMLGRIEQDLGVASTYFMLHPGDYNRSENYYGAVRNGRIEHATSFIDGCLSLQEMGHEVGLHNDFIQLSFLTNRPAKDLLEEEIQGLRRKGININGSASHGSDFARRLGFANYELFKECVSSSGKQGRGLRVGSWTHSLHSVSMQETGLNYEAYFVRRNADVSDTGSSLVVAFSGRREELNLANPQDFASYEETLRRMPQELRLQVLVHPCWWAEVS